jgi:hypothetical protein
MHQETLRNCHCSPDVHRTVRTRWVTRLAGNVARMREMRNAYRFLIGKHEGKRQLDEA